MSVYEENRLYFSILSSSNAPRRNQPGQTVNMQNADAAALQQAHAQVLQAQAQVMAQMQAMTGVGVIQLGAGWGGGGGAFHQWGVLSHEQVAAPRPEAYYKAKREEAERKARELLMANLNPTQLYDYTHYNYFWTTGPSGNRYKIVCDKLSGNIKAYPPLGKRVKLFGIIPLWRRRTMPPRWICVVFIAGSMPAGDLYLAQKLALEVDEENTLAVAIGW